MTAPARRLTALPAVATRAAGYIRVSTLKQSDGYSPELQEEAIRSYAAEHGLDVAQMESDFESGHKLTRHGYQRLLASVRSGTIGAVIVHQLDRLGRDGGELIVRCREMENLGVKLISVREGTEEPGIMRFVRSGMAEQYSRELARRVRPSLERSVREGKHHGIVPFGYVLRYQERTGGGRYQAGTLTRNEPAASFVTELYTRYASGQSLLELARWANNDPACPKSPKGLTWRTDKLNYILRNPVYVGHLRYNAQPSGRFERCEDGSEFTVPAEHEALIDQATFDQVQRRLTDARTGQFRGRLTDQPVPLCAGLLRCTCGGRMVISRVRDPASKHRPTYVCVRHANGEAVCKPSHYVASFAHEAVLAQIKRIQFKSWDLSRAASTVTPTVDPRPLLRKRLDVAKDELQRHIKNFTLLAGDTPTPQEVAAYRRGSNELSDKIVSIERELAVLPAPAPTPADAKALHAEFEKVRLDELHRPVRRQ